MNIDSITNEVDFLEVKIIKEASTIKIGEVFIPGIANFCDYATDLKIISCICPLCGSSVDFGIYENGGFIRGYGKSIRIKHSWVDGLTNEQVKYLSSLFDLGVKEVDEEKSYTGFFDKEELQPSFILLKECSCKTRFILCFGPTGKTYHETALQFFIHSCSQVDLSAEFLSEYINNELT
jgi:hypothetical protein